jgi:hypothetical protein
MSVRFPIVFFALLALVLLPVFVFAQGGAGGHSGGAGSALGAGGTTPPHVYLQNLYKWFLGFVGIAALFALVFGGVRYMFAGANIGEVGAAKGWIMNAIWGLLLAALSVLLLQTINPDLIQRFDFNLIIEQACNMAGDCYPGPAVN